MSTMVIICLLLLFDTTLGGASYILAEVCLTWKIKNDFLVLGCKTDMLDFAITFFDPVEKENAYCLPQAQICYSYIDASISQNITTNETFLSIPLGIDADKFNGWWNCRYGSSNGKAMVEITLSKLSLVEKKDIPSVLTSTDDMLLSSKIVITILAVVCFVLFCILFCCLYRNKNRSHHDDIEDPSHHVYIEESDRSHHDDIEDPSHHVYIEESDPLHRDGNEEIDPLHRDDDEGIESSAKIVHLKGPTTYVMRDQNVLINCTATKPPAGNYAEFLINGHTYTNLRFSSMRCLTGNKNINCNRGDCQCSPDGRWYSIIYRINTNDRVITFKCVMKYNDFGEQSDEQTSVILDIEGPFMTANKKYPFIAGVEVVINCTVSIYNITVQLIWDCMGLANHPRMYHAQDDYMSSISFVPSSKQNGTNCKCLVKVRDFEVVANITLEVTNSPALKLNQGIYCNSTKETVLSCEVSGELYKYGFAEWVHRFNGQGIRKLNGTVVGNLSFLLLQSCGYQDVGHYICRAWNDYNGQIFWATRKTTVKVLGPPFIVKKYLTRNHTTVLTAEFYSNPEPTCVQWHSSAELIINSNRAINNIIRTNVNILMYQQSVHVNGYTTFISLENSTNGKYTVVIKNAFGKIREEFEVFDTADFTFTITTIVWILTGIVVFILTVTITTVIMKICYTGRFSLEIATVVYHAAPQLESHVVSIYNVIQDQNDDCDEIRHDAGYIDAISTGQDITDSQSSSEHYEEVH